MSFSYELDPGQRLARLRMADTVGDGHGWDAMREMFSHPDFGPGYSLLADVRDVERLTASERDLHTLAAHAKAMQTSLKLVRIALLTTPHSHVSTIAERYIALRAHTPYTMRVFHCAHEAEAFLRGEAE